MNPRLLFKLLFAGIGAILIGLGGAADHAHWHQLGRDAFLNYQGHRFDMEMLKPANGLGIIVFCTLLVAGICALYEGAGWLGEKLFSRSTKTVPTVLQ